MLSKLRKTLRPTKRMAHLASYRLTELPYLLKRPAVGTAEWLIQREIAYGGYVSDVQRRKVSPFDRRSDLQLKFGGMTGGDRMLHHGYAAAYARYLRPFLKKRALTIVEFGILKGTGLAMWCDLFPNARVIGFDIDLSHFRQNQASLEALGAFRQNTPEIWEYDQFIESSRFLADVLKGHTIDVAIDDGFHSSETILTTWRSVMPHLSSEFVYFIEDYAGLLDASGNTFAHCCCHADGELTVITNTSPT